MISLEQAKKFAEKHFPDGPEKLAEKLNIKVCDEVLSGCDGWVLSGPEGILIRLNRTHSIKRRRFTLAHELGHLLLGIPTVVGESVYESLSSNSAEERAVNNLASELLLPESVVRQHLYSLPVVAASLKKLAKAAKISELATALRVANLASSIGLVNASVVFFRNDSFEWQWSQTLKMTTDVADRLLQEAKKRAPEPARIERARTKQMIVASIIENPAFSTTTLFVQLLPLQVGNQVTNPEKRRQLEEYLFNDDNAFRMSLQGVFGDFRPKCNGLSLEAAFLKFYQEKGNRWDGQRQVRLNSAKGKEYVRLRLSEWCK